MNRARDRMFVVLGTSVALHLVGIGATAPRRTPTLRPSSAMTEIAVETLAPPPRVAPLPLPSPRPVPGTIAPPPSSPASMAPKATRSASVPVAAKETPPDDALASKPRFALVFPAGVASAAGASSSSAGPAPNVGTLGAPPTERDGPIAERFVDAPARRLDGVIPTYPEGARREGIEADVKLELVVSNAGLVESAKVLGRVGHGLDEAALAATRNFRFKAAMRHGHAVRVRMAWNVAFRLQ